MIINRRLGHHTNQGSRTSSRRVGEGGVLQHLFAHWSVVRPATGRELCARRAQHRTRSLQKGSLSAQGAVCNTHTPPLNFVWCFPPSWLQCFTLKGATQTPKYLLGLFGCTPLMSAYFHLCYLSKGSWTSMVGNGYPLMP